jgi:hypothetical protein
MRRTASEVIRELEARIARMERSANDEMIVKLKSLAPKAIADWTFDPRDRVWEITLMGSYVDFPQKALLFMSKNFKSVSFNCKANQMYLELP